MLSISQSSNNFYCIEWIPTEKGPSVLYYDKIKISENLNQFNQFLDIILKNFSLSSLNTSSSLTLSIDIKNVGITSFKYDTNIPLSEFIDWYEKRILGHYIINNFEVFYYPLNTKDNVMMVIYINKQLKKNILDSCLKYDYKLLNLSVDIFSSYHSATQIFQASKLENFLIWKVGNNNYHYIVYFENNELSHFLKIKKRKNIECHLSIGDDTMKKQLIKLSNSILFKYNKNDLFVDKIFVYQLKNDFTKITSIFNKKIDAKIMDIGSLFLNKNINKNKLQHKLLCYNENGNSLRGIDV